MAGSELGWSLRSISRNRLLEKSDTDERGKLGG